MKHFKSLLVSMLAGSMMWACSSDQLIDPDQTLKGDDGEGVYMALDIQMPTGNLTRSETNEEGGSTGGTEIGTPEENTVTTALVVLAASSDISAKLPKFGFIAASEIQNDRILETTNPTKEYRATARLQKTNLNMLYDQYQAANITANPEVYVFVFANPTKELTQYFSQDNLFGDTDWVNLKATVYQNNPTKGNYNIGIWGTNSFLMNSASLTTRLLPKNILDWENYNSYDKPFHLSDLNEAGTEAVDNAAAGGPVSVQRSVARFDFKDGSGNNNTYKVLYAYETDGTQNKKAPIVDVQLQKMCLVNMANSFYYLNRVSPDGQNVNFTLCGKEKPWVRPNGDYVGGNYVVGPYADIFTGTVMNGFYDYFNFSFFEDDGSFNNEEMAATRWDVVKISDVLNGRDDNYVGKDNTDDEIAHKAGDYKVWRYVTANLIPGVNDQNYGVSTGVVFKGKFLGAYDAANAAEYKEQNWEAGSAENISKCLNGQPFTYNGKTIEKLTGDSKDDPILYYLNGKLYMGWRNLRQAAIQEAVTVTVSGDLEINRSGSLYKAVFGDGPIAPTYTITVPDGNGYKDETKKTVYIDKNGQSKDVVDPRWDPTTSPNDADYKASPDYAWQVWNGEGKETGDGLNATPELTAFRKAATEKGIAIYQTSKDDDYGVGYYCYYYYWNRHNDNHIPGTMGPMEFAVIRNNVYKLSVDNITRLGHPRIPDNDPDEPKPDTPDESDLIYLDVKVAILDWAVRLNSITF